MKNSMDVISAARSLVGTPFHEQGRVPGPRGGMDCVGVLVCTAKILGVRVKDVTNYKGTPNGLLERILDAQLRPLSPEDVQLGDIVLFKIRHLPQHVGILVSDNTIVHAEASSKKVVETSYDRRWRERTVDWYRFPGVEEDATWEAPMYRQATGQSVKKSSAICKGCLGIQEERYG